MLIFKQSFKREAVAKSKQGYTANQIFMEAGIDINKYAQKFNMAESSFYRHFSKVTSLSPLQYQKKLRLYEAHRLMLSENMDVANAAYEVGYESPSQFNREYKRLFGIPPKTNIGRLKAC